MAKLYFKKIEKCDECPYSKIMDRVSSLNDYGNFIECSKDNKKIENVGLVPDWCSLIEFETLIEANETNRGWVRIN